MIGTRLRAVEKAGLALILMWTCCGYRPAAICNPEAARENVVVLLNGYLEELGQALTCKYLDSCISNCLLSDILELGNGFAFKSGAYTKSGRYKVLTIKNVQDGNVDCSSSSRLDEPPIKMKEHCKLKPGDVVLSLTGNVGRVGIVAETSCLLNQRVAVLLPRDEHCIAGLYFVFRQQSFRSEVIGIAKGTAQANLSPVETLRLSIPYDESTFQELSAILRPVFDGILANKIESLKLAKFRNLLLPKLMSGEIDVSKIDLTQLNSHLLEFDAILEVLDWCVEIAVRTAVCVHTRMVFQEMRNALTEAVYELS